jgi:molybdate transport system regulatory protein
MAKKNIKLRCWIEMDDLKFFGPGRAELLILIDQEGSLSKAAKKMGMSYKKAWDMVNDLNTRGKNPFVIMKQGGEKGGGASLSEHARIFLKKYQTLDAKLQEIIQQEADLLEDL